MMTRHYSQGEEYLRKMSREDREARRRELWKDHVLYWCPNCGGLWYPRMKPPSDGTTPLAELPDSFPCGRPCFGQMVKQREPQRWEEQAEMVREGA